MIRRAYIKEQPIIKLVLIASFVCCFNIVFAQKDIKETTSGGEIIFDCPQPLVPRDCNYIPNATFSCSGATYSAFANGNVANWADSHGTSDVNNAAGTTSMTAPFSGTNFVSMGIGYNAPNDPVFEGICAKIKPLTANNNYALSFFRSLSKLSIGSSAISGVNVKFKIVLIKCQNFAEAGTDYTLPSMPSNNQVVFCENLGNLSNGNLAWKQGLVQFTANDSYDMIWIFPEIDNASTYYNQTYYFHFAYPELIDLSNTISVDYDNSSCPSDLSAVCKIKNAQYEWYDPNGDNIGNSDQVSIGPPISGTYTLNITVPSSITSTNACIAINTNVNATANLNNCNCGTLMINNAVANYYRVNPPTNVNPYYYSQPLDVCGDNSICYNGEEWVGIEAESNMLTGNYWEVVSNNPMVLINSGTTTYNTTSQNLYINITIPTSNFALSEILTAIIEVKLTNTTTSEVKHFYIKLAYNIHSNGFVFRWCNSVSNPGFDGIMQGGYINDPAYSYSWTFPSGMYVDDLNIANPKFKFNSYSGSYPVDATVIVSHIYCPANPVTATVSLEPSTAICNAKGVSNNPILNTIDLINEKDKTRFYPNPVSSTFRIESNKKIRSVSISSIEGKLIKHFFDANSKSLNISELTKGSYLMTINFADFSKETKIIIKQ